MDIVINKSSEFDEIEKISLRTASFLAVEIRKHDVVATLLERSISPNLTNYQGQSLLRATAKDDYGMVKTLLASNSDVDQRDKNGRTALMAKAGSSRDTGRTASLQKPFARCLVALNPEQSSSCL